jgi:hypothetical protein
MELNGALSNPPTSHKRLQMSRLVAARSDISIREQVRERPSQRHPRRQGAVLTAVTSALADAAQPMRVSEIHVAVEQLLGSPVAYSSVKEALSAHTRGADRRFTRIRRGCYELS